MGSYLQPRIIKILSILSDEWFSCEQEHNKIWNAEKFALLGRKSSQTEREAVRVRDSNCLHFTLTDWKQTGFLETWLWKQFKTISEKARPFWLCFLLRNMFLSTWWLCRKVAACKHSRKEVVQKSWPSFSTSMKPMETLTKGISFHVYRSYQWLQALPPLPLLVVVCVFFSLLSPLSTP